MCLCALPCVCASEFLLADPQEHSLLENCQDPKHLCWITDDAFRISASNAHAIQALAPAFHFNQYVGSPSRRFYANVLNTRP